MRLFRSETYTAHVSINAVEHEDDHGISNVALPKIKAASLQDCAYRAKQQHVKALEPRTPCLYSCWPRKFRTNIFRNIVQSMHFKSQVPRETEQASGLESITKA